MHEKYPLAKGDHDRLPKPELDLHVGLPCICRWASWRRTTAESRAGGRRVPFCQSHQLPPAQSTGVPKRECSRNQLGDAESPRNASDLPPHLRSTITTTASGPTDVSNLVPVPRDRCPRRGSSVEGTRWTASVSRPPDADRAALGPNWEAQRHHQDDAGSSYGSQSATTTSSRQYRRRRGSSTTEAILQHPG